MLTIMLMASVLLTFFIASSVKTIEQESYLRLPLPVKGRECDNCGAPDQGVRCVYCRKVR